MALKPPQNAKSGVSSYVLVSEGEQDEMGEGKGGGEISNGIHSFSCESEDNEFINIDECMKPFDIIPCEDHKVKEELDTSSDSILSFFNQGLNVALASELVGGNLFEKRDGSDFFNFFGDNRQDEFRLLHRYFSSMNLFHGPGTSNALEVGRYNNLLYCRKK